MRWELVQLVAMLVAATVLMALLPTHAYYLGLMTGLLVASCVAVVGFAFLLGGDAAYLIAGTLGENHTIEELAKAQKQGLI